MSKLAKRARPQRQGSAPRPWPALFRPNLARDVDRLFHGLWWPWRSIARGVELPTIPAIDLFEEGDTVVVKAELPGLEKDDIDVQLTGDVLTISGRKEREEKVERKSYLRYERRAGEFRRSVRLPVAVQPDRITAQLRNGVLEVRAPKIDGPAPNGRKIPVA